MKKELEQVGRRQLIAKAGLALGGVVTLGALQACGSDESPATPPVDTPATGPQVADFPYDQHIAAGFQMDTAPIQEAAYHAYYNGGCCHGSYSALLGHLAQKVGAPFNLLPLDLGKFGAGGIAGYGSICGSLLGGVMIINQIVSNADVRGKMMTELMRWYEGNAFPHFVPDAVDVKEIGKTTLDFSAANIGNLQVVPGSHLCHPSVSGWCAAQKVAATSPDKLARCSRLTADVAGKVAELINTYLANGSFTWTALDATSATCTTCHPASAPAKPVASGMACTSCHPTKTTYPHPL